MNNARSNLSAVACGVGLLVVSTTPVLAQSPDDDLWQSLFGPARGVPGDWTRHFRMGALVGFNLKADFSMSGTFSVSGNNPGAADVRGVNHDYDDGYVRVDVTGNDQNATWYWGYRNADQVAGQRLFFHSADSFEASGSVRASSGANVGFDTAYGGRLGRVGSGLVGWELGFGWLPVKITDSQPMTASVTQTLHWYDISGWDSIPAAPYEGTFEGPSTKLNDLATAAPGGAPAPATLTGSRTLDVTLYNFRLGPTLHWEFHPRFAVAMSAGAAFGIVSGDLKYNETLQFSGGGTASNQGKGGSTEFAYGGYVAGTLLYHAVMNGDIYAGFQYMPMTSTTFGSDGREAKLDLSGGLYISAGIHWPF